MLLESWKAVTVPYNICFSKIRNILTMRGILNIKFYYFTLEKNLKLKIILSQINVLINKK